MATALAVLSVGAIPVVAEIDESIMISPESVRDTIGPHTRAVIPVHMWGQLCDMDSLLKITDEHDIRVLEDACQCVGGFYGDRAAGSMGNAGAFSFNIFKNMICGEGGGVITDDERVFERVCCMIDPCCFYWKGRSDSLRPFSNCGSRASEFEGAMLNAQLDRIEGLLARLREIKEEIFERTADAGLRQCPRHAPEGECATSILYLLPDEDTARAFAEHTGGTVLLHTGRHTYTEWDQVLAKRGSHHPALNPYDLPQNARCRKDYSADMCSKSLDILARAVKIDLNPGFSIEKIERLVTAINTAPCGTARAE
jgi:dTDP-4-amino-4,6-dideoxygalactose transaminase